MFLAFKNGVKSIQTAGYNGARTVHCTSLYICQKPAHFYLPKWLCWSASLKCLYYLGCITLCGVWNVNTPGPMVKINHFLMLFLATGKIISKSRIIEPWFICNFSPLYKKQIWKQQTHRNSLEYHYLYSSLFVICYN